MSLGGNAICFISILCPGIICHLLCSPHVWMELYREFQLNIYMPDLQLYRFGSLSQPELAADLEK